MNVPEFDMESAGPRQPSRIVPNPSVAVSKSGEQPSEPELKVASQKSLTTIPELGFRESKTPFGDWFRSDCEQLRTAQDLDAFPFAVKSRRAGAFIGSSSC